MKFPSMKARELLRVLGRKPLEYSVDHQTGSHRCLISASGYPTLNFAFHDGDTMAPGLVRKILVQQVGLSEKEAKDLL